MKFKFSNFIWGAFLLLLAAFVLFNQFDHFANIGLSIGRIIAAVLSLLVIVQCIANLQLAPLPFPLALLYYIFQPSLGLPEIKIRALIIASILASIGLSILLPKKHRYKHCKDRDCHPQLKTESINNDNNPSVSVNFGSDSKSIYSENLETIQINCNFGALEIFLDQAKLSPNGAEVIINCSFGGIELYIPKHWRVINKLKCSLGAVDTNKVFTASANDAPQITLTGSISLGGVEVRYL